MEGNRKKSENFSPEDIVKPIFTGLKILELRYASHEYNFKKENKYS